jgi:integral membrane protein
MRFASLLEGTTLLGLVFVAVPLKHLAGYPGATSVVGPIHGMAFLTYTWMLAQSVSGGEWSKRNVVCMVAAAFIPFGAFVNERVLRHREAVLSRPE